MGGREVDDGEIKSHGCRRGEALVWRGPTEVRIMGVINEFMERMGR